MIGYGHVFVMAIFGRFGHFFDGVPAVSFDGMHVHIALQVFKSSRLGNV